MRWFFRAFGQKHTLLGNFENFWWKFNRKFGFLTIFGKFVTENRAFGNNISFLQQFFSVSGGGDSPSPLGTTIASNFTGRGCFEVSELLGVRKFWTFYNTSMKIVNLHKFRVFVGPFGHFINCFRSTLAKSKIKKRNNVNVIGISSLERFWKACL